MDFLVDTGVTQKVKQDLLRHAHGAEVLHFCRREVKGQRLENVRTAASVTTPVKTAV